MSETDEIDDARGPSRSQLRREALDIFKMADTLASMSDAELSRVPLDDELRTEVVRTRAVTSHIARKRQTQFLAKQIRKLDDEAIEPIRRALENDRLQAHQDAAALHRVEAWRTRIVDEGDPAIDALLALHPTADRQRLRQLSRNVRTERERNKPPAAFRELFRELRELLDVRDA